VVVAAVPWARPGSRFTTAFEDTCAWLVCHATLSVVAILLRVAWRSVSDIVARVLAARREAGDRLAGLRRIGIDEISYRKGQRYLLVVTDHDTGRLVWAGKDRTAATLRQFFDDLAPGPGGGVDPRQRRWRGVHPHRGHRARPESRAVPGCLPCGGLGHQGPR
jgi:transposase